MSEQMLNVLTDHVSYIEKEKEAIIKSFYADNAGAGMDIEAFFRDYTAAVSSYIDTVRTGKADAAKNPPAIIGSTVEVLDTAEQEKFSYQIVLPLAKKAGSDMSHASCLSPLGRALLMKSAGSRVSIQTPAGLLDYEIVHIKLPEHDSNDKTEKSRTHLHPSASAVTV